jgi:XTP/dITP diphosphohydrolase
MKICFATNNLNKLAEIQSKVGSAIQLMSLKEIGCNEELPETQDSIEGNALQKAQYVFDNFHVPCFADDTGLCIDALNGAPGVFSARYAGPECNSNNNIQKVLNELKGIDNRSAFFKTCIALKMGRNPILFEGICKGEILNELKGEKGFGYDPIFMPDGYNLSFAEMSMEEKNKISHRGIATEKLLLFLTSL